MGRYEGMDESLGGSQCQEPPNVADSPQLKRSSLADIHGTGEGGREWVSSKVTPRFLA